MITKSKAREKSLLSIIKQMFSYWLDPKKQEKILKSINPNLTEKLLQKLIKDARKIIIDLYISCETDFQKGLGLFEAIVKAKMMSTAQRRIAHFEKADELQDEPIEEKKAPVETEEKMPPVEGESGPPVDDIEEKMPPVEGESEPDVGAINRRKSTC